MKGRMTQKRSVEKKKKTMLHTRGADEVDDTLPTAEAFVICAASLLLVVCTQTKQEFYAKLLVFVLMMFK
jgi:hypothetical protein